MKKLGYDKHGNIVVFEDGKIIDKIETMGNNIENRPTKELEKEDADERGVQKLRQGRTDR